ncbi:MAG: HDIG domain-containing protein, partial [Bacteroidaceae bacterium]|nr:HDIG domain-containing protein [Bacteroidaceae bacterium]
TALMVRSSLFSVWIIPYAMAPITIRILMDARTAFTANVAMVMLCSLSLSYPYEFILIQIISGLVSILSLKEMSERSQLFRTAAIVTVVNMLFYFCYSLMTENVLIDVYKYLAINGVILLFTYPMLYMLEKTFGFTSDVTLVELSNINKPLLQKLSEVAPGTFQHSLQVANLAAEVARKIEAKTQLVRTGALYHDIGKMKDPVFFTENQSGVNPHNNLDELQSATIIINHIHYGLKLAEKHSLPQSIRDFISTHHGSGLTKYFYINYQNRHPDEVIDKEPFTYPGPNPFTKEQAILMMADSVEAASRSLPEYTEESISGLVDKIIDAQTVDGCFKECPITFLDIAIAKRVFKEKLKTIYHTRVSYPELKK